MTKRSRKGKHPINVTVTTAVHKSMCACLYQEELKFSVEGYMCLTVKQNSICTSIENKIENHRLPTTHCPLVHQISYQSYPKLSNVWHVLVNLFLCCFIIRGHPPLLPFVWHHLPIVKRQKPLNSSRRMYTSLETLTTQKKYAALVWEVPYIMMKYWRIWISS